MATTTTANLHAEQEPMPQHFCRISSVLQSEGKAVPLPYSASNARCKDELHLALTITFPLSSFLPGAPEFFIRCHSGLSTSIRCASSLHPAVNVNTWRNCIFFLLLLRSWWFPPCFLDYRLCKPCTCENGFYDYFFSTIDLSYISIPLKTIIFG